MRTIRVSVVPPKVMVEVAGVTKFRVPVVDCWPGNAKPRW